MLRLCLFTGSHPHQAQQGLQQGVVCRAGSWELDVHVQEFPALLYDLMNTSLAEGKRTDSIVAKACIKDLNFLEIWFLPLHGPIFLNIHQQHPGSTMEKVAPAALLQSL